MVALDLSIKIRNTSPHKISVVNHFLSVNLQSLKWREHWGADDIENWKAPEVIEKYFPSGISGYDKGGAPVIIVPFAGLDMVGMIHSAPRSDFVR